MAAQIVVGVFESRSIAQDARNRLHTEGVADSAMSIVVLRETAPVPAPTQLSRRRCRDDPLVLAM